MKTGGEEWPWARSDYLGKGRRKRFAGGHVCLDRQFRRKHLGAAKRMLLVCPDDANGEERRRGSDAGRTGYRDGQGRDGGGRRALSLLSGQAFDGMVVHLDLEDMPAIALISRLCRRNVAALLRHRFSYWITRAFSESEEQNLTDLARSSTVKPVYSLERLLDDSVLLFHRAEANLPPQQRRVLDQIRETDTALFGKTVLVVDDDVRNIFALTSLLEEHNLNVVHAENGQAGIELLTNTPGVSISS